MVIDNDSPPGAWAEELRRAPWGYGQGLEPQVQMALTEIRARGLFIEAGVLEQRIISLETQLADLRR